MQKLNKAIGLAAGIVLAAVAFHAPAQGRDFSKVEIKTVKLTESIYVLFGAGGNIGVSVGEDGVFLIDDQYAPLSAKILAAVRKLSDKPIRFVINTHWHRDHTGGNEAMGRAGAAIVAHENVRRRLASPQSIPAFNMKTKPAPAAALPQVTFGDAVSLHFNGDHARILHQPAAHTDGDAFVHFTRANVIHAGDLFFNGIYPFIDGSNGGSITGVIKAVDMILGIANEKTRIIPGHGPMATRRDLVKYRDMLKSVHGRVARAMSAGQSAKELVKSGAFNDIEKSWGGGFLNTQKFITVVYAGLKPQ